MFYYFRRLFCYLLLCNVFVVGSVAQAHELINYGQENQVWLNKLHALARGEPVKFRILQLGDSHTAADFFTNTARERLQNQFGSGGIGWVFPSSVRSQNDERVSYVVNGGWETLTSHRDEGTFPFGGVIANATGDIPLTIRAKKLAENVSSTVIFSVKAPYQGAILTIRDAAGRVINLRQKVLPEEWSYVYVKAVPPVEIQARNMAPWTLGPVSIENNAPGIVYSVMGINGAQLREVRRWQTGWVEDLKRTQADLVILAYGTNEAFNQPFPYASIEQLWQKTVHDIQQTLPDAGILIIGAPESLKSTKGNCGIRPVGLDAIQEIQQRVAAQNGLLYWSWQEVMGGKCSMKTWIQQKLGRRDGIHFTMSGYDIVGNRLADALINLANEK